MTQTALLPVLCPWRPWSACSVHGGLARHVRGLRVGTAQRANPGAKEGCMEEGAPGNAPLRVKEWQLGTVCQQDSVGRSVQHVQL